MLLTPASLAFFGEEIIYQQKKKVHSRDKIKTFEFDYEYNLISSLSLQASRRHAKCTFKKYLHFFYL